MLTNTYDLETSDLRSHPVFTTANKFNMFFLLLVIPFCCVLLVRIHSTHTFTHSTNVYAQAVLLNCARATSSSETDDDSDNGGGGGSSSGCGEKKINNNTRFLVSLVKLNSKCVDVCYIARLGAFSQLSYFIKHTAIRKCKTNGYFIRKLRSFLTIHFRYVWEKCCGNGSVYPEENTKRTEHKKSKRRIITKKKLIFDCKTSVQDYSNGELTHFHRQQNIFTEQCVNVSVASTLSVLLFTKCEYIKLIWNWRVKCKREAEKKKRKKNQRKCIHFTFCGWSSVKSDSYLNK